MIIEVWCEGAVGIGWYPFEVKDFNAMAVLADQGMEVRIP